MSSLPRTFAALLVACAAAMTTAAAGQGTAHPIAYLVVDDVIDLGTLWGHSWSEAHAINAGGSIAGSSATAPSGGLVRAVFWSSPGDAPINLGHLGGSWSEAWGISDANHVVGNSMIAGESKPRGFRWRQATGMVDLGLVGKVLGTGPVVWFTAKDISNNGAIVGSFSNKSANNGGMGGYAMTSEAHIVPNCAVVDSSANALNDAGYYTGQAYCTGGGPVFEAYRGAGLQLSSGFGGIDAVGHGINETGHVVGSNGSYHAFKWTQTGGSVDLQPNEDDAEYHSVANGINKDDLVVGAKSRKDGSATYAFVYGQGISMTTLPALCTRWPANSTAFAVNRDGWVVGGSQTCSGEYHATLWKVHVVPALGR